MDAAFTFWKLHKETLQARYGKALDPCSRDYNVMLKLIYASRFPKGPSLGLALAGAWTPTDLPNGSGVWVVVHGIVEVHTAGFLKCTQGHHLIAWCI